LLPLSLRIVSFSLSSIAVVVVAARYSRPSSPSSFDLVGVDAYFGSYVARFLFDLCVAFVRATVVVARRLSLIVADDVVFVVY